MLIRSMCVTKTLTSWHLNKTATTCRERCGGGSFLLNSAIPEGIISAHSGMTAEGDNSVLMQKVVKDILSDMQKKQHDLPKLTQCPVRQIPKMASIASFETLKNLIFYMEIEEIKSFSKLMKKKIMEEGEAFFDVWMYQVSDEIQALAHAFGERYLLEGALKNLAECQDAKLKIVLGKSIHLHMIDLVREKKAWFLARGVISASAAQALDEEHNVAVADFVPHMNTVLNGMSLVAPVHLQGPITRDYVAFNNQGDYENIDAAGELFDFTKTGAPRPRL